MWYLSENGYFIDANRVEVGDFCQVREEVAEDFERSEDGGMQKVRIVSLYSVVTFETEHGRRFTIGYSGFASRYQFHHSKEPIIHVADYSDNKYRNFLKKLIPSWIDKMWPERIEMKVPPTF